MISAYIFTFMFMVSQKRLTVPPVKQSQVSCYGRAKGDNLIRGYRGKAHLSLFTGVIFLKGHLRKPWYSAIS